MVRTRRMSLTYPPALSFNRPFSSSGNVAFQLSASGDTIVLGNTVYTWSSTTSAYALQYSFSMRGIPAAIALDRSAPDGEGIVAF